MSDRSVNIRLIKNQEKVDLKPSFSAEVPVEGLFSHHFIDDLKKMANLDTLFNNESLVEISSFGTSDVIQIRKGEINL